MVDFAGDNSSRSSRGETYDVHGTKCQLEHYQINPGDEDEFYDDEYSHGATDLTVVEQRDV